MVAVCCCLLFVVSCVLFDVCCVLRRSLLVAFCCEALLASLYCCSLRLFGAVVVCVLLSAGLLCVVVSWLMSIVCGWCGFVVCCVFVV